MLLKGKEFDTAHFISDVSGKYPRLWALKGAHPVTVNRWYKFGVLASIRTIAPGFREISELPDWTKKKAAGPATKKKQARGVSKVWHGTEKDEGRTLHEEKPSTTQDAYQLSRLTKGTYHSHLYIKSSERRRKIIEI
ncbi:hypothetical protein ACS0TY_017166 [Phlomoides rotata]